MNNKQLTIPKDIKPLKIKNEKTLTEAVEILSRANKHLDYITEQKELLTKPINQTLKEIRSRYKPLEDQLESIIHDIRRQMTAYQTSVENKKLAKQLTISTNLKQGKIDLEKAVNKMANTATVDKFKTESGSLKFRPTQTLKVTDIDLIPRIYFDLNESRLLSTLKQGKQVEGAKIEVKQVPINHR